MNIRNEANFVIQNYLLNIFILWGFFLIVTYWLSFNPYVNKFRTMLWFNQFHWLFLAPFLVYVGLVASRKIKTKHKDFSKKAAVVGLVLGIGVGAIALDYAFFMAGILMIIPEQFPVTKKDPVEFDKLEKILHFGEFFAFPLVNVVQLRVRKKLEDNGDIELGRDFGRKTKIIFICGIFLIALLWVINYNNVNSFWNYNIQ